MQINLNPSIPALQKTFDKKSINVRYMLIPPYASAHIYWDDKISELVYEIEEPILGPEEKIMLENLENALLELVNVNVAIEKSVEATTEYIDKTARLLIDELNMKITPDAYQRMFYYLFRDFVGFNEIFPLLKDYYIEDIECNGIDTPVYIVHRIYRNLKTNLVYKDIDKLGSFVEKLSQRCGRYISYAQPILDGSLPDGSIDYEEPVVYRENGMVKISKIGEVVDKFYKKDSDKPVSVSNLEVPAFDKDTFKISWKKVDYVYRHKADEEIYELKTEFGKKIKLTGCHSIFKLTKEGLKSERTDKLNEGDYVAFPLSIPVNNKIKEINLAEEMSNLESSKEFVIDNVPENIYASKKEELYSFYRENYEKPNQAFYEHKNKGIIPLKLHSLLSRENLIKSTIRPTSAIGIKPILKIDKNLMFFLGLYVAEGWLSKDKRKVYFCLNQNETDLIERLRMSAKECFNVDIYVEPPVNHAVKIVINSYSLCNALNDILKLSRGAKNKRVPEIVFNVDRELQKEFIEAWVAGDYGSTASKSLVEDISYLALFNEDIVAFQGRERESVIKGRSIKSYEHYTNFYNREVKNTYSDMIPLEIFNPLRESHMRLKNKRMNRQLLKKALEDIRYQRMQNIKSANSPKFVEEWTKRGFIEGEMLTQKGMELLAEREVVNKLIDSDLGFAKIKSITKVQPSSQYVYDFSVKDCENFVGGIGGLCCHNSRVNATYTKDITSKGPTFTIRKFTKIPWTPTQLISLNTMSPEMLAYFWILLENKSSVLISGGTASGKTTILNALAFFIPPEARVISIEDSVTGDSKIIIRKNGKILNITIKEFVDNKIDAEVMTLDKKNNIVFVKPSNYIKHKVKKDIYEVITSTGRKIKVTKDHSLFGLGSDNNLKEIKPTELQENKSFVAVPRVLPVEGEGIKEINLMNHLSLFEGDFLCGEPIKNILSDYKYQELGITKEKLAHWRRRKLIKIKDFLRLNLKVNEGDLKDLKIKSKNTSSIPVIFEVTKELIEFLGLWLGDGSYDNYNGNSVILSNVDEECRNIFIKIRDYIGANSSEMTDGGVSQRIHSTIFYKFMKYVLGFDGYSNTKRIPEFILNLSNEQIKHFIRGYFSADGCVKKYEVSCASQSYELLSELQGLFLRLGIISRINDFERKDKCINMSVSSSDNLQKFREIGFLQERKNIILRRMNSKAHHTCSDIIPLSIEKLKDLKEISLENLQDRYIKGFQNIGRNYLQRIAPTGSEFNDISHNDILWDKVKSVKKISSDEIEVFDLSIPDYEKFLCNNIFVHNTRELNLPRENWLPAVARSSIGSGKIGEVDLFDLLKSSFRQTPDYLIVGEVRGKEAAVLFQGMASGHASLSTMHADSVDTLIRRLQTPPIELSPTLINTLDCVAIATHAIAKKQETRRLREIVEIININNDGSAIVNIVFNWNAKEDKFYFRRRSRVFEKISIKRGIPIEKLQSEFSIRTKLLYELYKRKIFGFEEMQRIINEYYKNPELVLEKYGIKE